MIRAYVLLFVFSPTLRHLMSVSLCSAEYFERGLRDLTKAKGCIGGVLSVFVNTIGKRILQVWPEMIVRRG